MSGTDTSAIETERRLTKLEIRVKSVQDDIKEDRAATEKKLDRQWKLLLVILAAALAGAIRVFLGDAV